MRLTILPQMVNPQKELEVNIDNPKPSVILLKLG